MISPLSPRLKADSDPRLAVSKIAKSAILLLAAAVFVQSYVGAVSAATLLSVQSGSVLVDEGNGFATVTGERNIAAGSRILLKADAKASLKDDTSKCSLRLIAERVLTVPVSVPCTASIQTSAMHAGAPPADAIAEPIETTDAAPPSGGPSPLLIGVGVAGVVGLAVAVSSKNGSKNSDKKISASP